jgi:hypothetical protein
MNTPEPTPAAPPPGPAERRGPRDTAPSGSRPPRGTDRRKAERRNMLLWEWGMPMGIIIGMAVVVFFGGRLLDLIGTTGTLFGGLLEKKGDAIEQTVGNIAQSLPGILGLVITVVAIVVQLAAQRYTPKLIDLFVVNRVNIAYFLLMIVATIYCIILAFTSKDQVVPYWGAALLLLLTVLILALLAPYFAYVFRFLTPDNIIRIIRRNAKTAMGRVKADSKPGELVKLQSDVANSMEQISDISLAAVSQMDRNVALQSIRALRDVMVDHLLVKRKLPRRWFVPQKEHFPAISTDFLHEIAVTRTWVEVKGFMDLDLIFKMAIKDMPDGVSAIANSTKLIGLYAIRLHDMQVLANVVQFFNTFLRHAINDRNPKAIYNLLYQYRLLAEAVLRADPKLAERIAFYFKYYGQTAQSYQIPLILITASFDLMQMLRRAHEMNVPNLNALVTTFLEVDDNPATKANEFDLRSVRKAQLVFAAYLLSKGDQPLVDRILDDIKGEPRDRMMAIRNEMMAVKDRKFWEVTDRGVDFFYIDEEQKKHLNELYTRFIEPHYTQMEK